MNKDKKKKKETTLNFDIKHTMISNNDRECKRKYQGNNFKLEVDKREMKGMGKINVPI